MSNSEKPEAVGEMWIDFDRILGRIEVDQRNVKIGPGSYECQSRSRRYDRHGKLVETTEWGALSRITGVPDNLAYMLR